MSIERALTIDGWMEPGELELLQELASRVPEGGRVVEIGSFKGRSTVAICDALRATPGVRMWAVDTFEGDPDVRRIKGDVSRDEILGEFRKNTAEFGFLDAVIADSREAAHHFEDASLDWVFIDAYHSYAAALGDILAWAPKLKGSGLMSGHDFGRFGVTDAVLQSFANVEHRHSIWFTTDRPRPRIAIALRRLVVAVRRRSA